MERWVVAYDIPDDKRRRRLATALENFGDRVQYSVFEIITRGEDLDTVLKSIKGIISDEEDSVRLYPLCASCSAAVTVLGTGLGRPWDEPEVLIV